MNPNWSAVAALGRTLLILAASTFVGALVLPLAADGTLPVTWAAWRPVLAVAGSAAVVAEITWLRTHLSAVAKAAGVVSAPAQAVATAARAAAALVLIVAFGLTQTACSAFWGGASATLDCASKVSEDAAQNMSVAAIVMDLPSQCGMDAAAVMAILLGSKDGKVQASPAFAESTRARAMLMSSEPAAACGK